MLAEVRLNNVALSLDPLEIAIIRSHREERELMGAPDPQRPIEPTHTTVSVEKLPVGHEHAEVRFRIEVVAEPAPA